MKVEDASAHASARVAELRSTLKARGLDGFIVPKTDEFQNESVPLHADRLRWLTGFTGSAGVAVILEKEAALIVDSRYTLQARDQADSRIFTIELAPKASVASYLKEHARNGAVIGYDPALHTLAGFKSLKEEAEKRGFELHPCVPNPIDGLWANRPAASFTPIFAHEEAYAGESAASKIERVRKAVAEKGGDALFIGAPEAIAWLLNIRGRDIPHTPVVLVRAILPMPGKPILFVQPAHVTPENRAFLSGLVELRELATFHAKLLQELIGPGRSIIADPARTTIALADALKGTGAKLIEAQDPIVLFKAKKNAVELTGARAAQKRDGVSLSKFLCWLDCEAPKGNLDEITASGRLEAFRRETGKLMDLSFDTISGAGPNGAIVHYRATPETNRKLEPGSLYLIDSGGQYLDGTTDVTRTVAIGAPADEMRRHFTLVLKGHIALATAVFPEGTRGVDIDGFARRALWSAGLDYGHGTGHGIGSFLSVHEGPQNISRNGMAALEPGMIVSNEPGYYREGHYGIRIENLIAVTPAEPVEGGETPMMRFETLTLAPIDRRLIAAELLTPDEIAWLDAYHARVFDEIAPALGQDEKAWLRQATAPLSSQ